MEIDADGPALLPGVEALLRAGVRTGASSRNWASYGDQARVTGEAHDWRRDLLTDPQTSGGLLIAAAPDAAQRIVGMAREQGYEAARVVGRVGEAGGVR